jgi:hypothetical protein
MIGLHVILIKVITTAIDIIDTNIGLKLSLGIRIFYVLQVN